MFHQPSNTAGPAFPDDREASLPPPHKILETIARPAAKIAGVRRAPADPKGKGKQRASEPGPVASGSNLKRKASTPLSSGIEKKSKGRSVGAANYSSEDLDGMFDILEELLPLGGHAWNSASDDFNAWAEENGRPTCTSRSLELKFKQVCIVLCQRSSSDSDTLFPACKDFKADW